MVPEKTHLDEGVLVKGVEMESLSSPPVPFDCELVIQAQLGEEEPFRELIERYDRRLSAKVNKSIWNKAIVEDICQEVRLLAWRNLPTLQDPCKFWRWYYRIAFNLVKRPPKNITGGSDDGPLEDDAQDRYTSNQEFSPENFAILKDTFKRALQKIPKKKREAVIRHLLGEPNEQIAKAIQLPLATVKAYIPAGMKILREELPEFFLSKPNNQKNNEPDDQENRKGHE